MRLIDGDSLKHQIIETYEYEFPTASGAFDEFVTKIIPNIINNAPTVDAVEVVHGRWESVCGCIVRCNSCGSEAARKSNYCPNCGARMDGEP